MSGQDKTAVPASASSVYLHSPTACSCRSLHICLITANHHAQICTRETLPATGFCGTRAIVPVICPQVRFCTPYQLESHFPFFCYLFSENTIFQNTKRSFIRLCTTLFPAKPETQAEMNRNARVLYYHKYIFRAFLCFFTPAGASCTHLHTLPHYSAGAAHK